MLSIHQELLWLGVFFLLITGLYLQLMQSNHALVPISRPFIFLLAEIAILTWVWYGEWNNANRLTWLLSFVVVGCLLLYQSFAHRRWYVFHGGGFMRSMESYDLLARDITQLLWLASLPPSTVIFRYEGVLGLSDIGEKDEAELFEKIDETLEDTRWRKRGAWHFFFTVQWIFVISVLVIQIFMKMR